MPKNALLADQTRPARHILGQNITHLRATSGMINLCRYAIRDQSSGVGFPHEVDRGTSCTATSGSAKRSVVLDESDAEKARRASVGPYSATVAPIPAKPATPIHRSRPRDGSAAISRPGMSHRSVDSMLNANSGYDGVAIAKLRSTETLLAQPKQ